MRLRLLLTFVLIVLVTLASLIFFARRGTEQAVGEFMVHGGMIDSRQLIDSLEAYYAETGSWQGVQQLIGLRGSGQGPGMGGMMGGQGMMSVQRLRIAGVDEVYVADSQAESVGTRMTAEERADALSLHGPDGSTAGYLVGEGGIGSELPLLNRINQAALRAGLFAGLLALALGLVLAYTFLRPIQNLTRAAEGMSRGDLNQRVRVEGRDEIARLGQTFNSMAASLQEAEAGRRAMTADIAHELRTPLAVQRAQLEALQDGIYPLTQENLQPLLDQNILLGRLVEDLRTLALADAGELTIELVPVDPRTLCPKVLDRFRPQAAERQIALRFETDPEQDCPAVKLDPLRAEQVLSNLLSNALRFTPVGGQVVVRVMCSPSQVALEVQDSGPGIPEASLPRIFERFYRAERSRTRSDGGSGLGLAIARQLVHSMGGEITAHNTGSGALFRCVFPVVQTENGGAHV